MEADSHIPESSAPVNVQSFTGLSLEPIKLLGGFLNAAICEYNTAFLIHDHVWQEQPENPLSNVESVKGAISVGNVYNLELLGGAFDCPGDYLYRSGALRWDVESGMWGILRIKTRTVFCTLASHCRDVGQWWEKVWKKE